ncbi:hypothetical protein Hanom_Chr15g01363681 [Helianthus anomalus]
MKETDINGINVCMTMMLYFRDELGIDWYRNRKYRYQKSAKVGTGTEYTRYGTVRYRYLRVKTGKYWYKTGTVPDRYRKCQKSVPKMYPVW